MLQQYATDTAAATASNAAAVGPCLHDLHFIDCFQLFLLSETIDADLQARSYVGGQASQASATYNW